MNTGNQECAGNPEPFYSFSIFFHFSIIKTQGNPKKTLKKSPLLRKMLWIGWKDPGKKEKKKKKKNLKLDFENNSLG